VFRQIPKKNTYCGAWCEFVSGCGREVRIALAPKKMKVGKIGMNAKKGEMWHAEGECFGRAQVEEVGCHMEGFYPISSGKTSLEHEQARNVIGGTNDVLHAPILGRGVWAGHTHGYAMGEKEGMCTGIVKLLAVITLDGFNGAPKLCTNMSKEVRQSLKCV
jgi:hypothetical protein